MVEEEKIGVVTHYYGKISVAVVELSGEMVQGDRVKIRGKETDFIQGIRSMQVEHRKIDRARPGDMVGIKVDRKVREGDGLFKITG